MCERDKKCDDEKEEFHLLREKKEKKKKKKKKKKRKREMRTETKNRVLKLFLIKTHLDRIFFYKNLCFFLFSIMAFSFSSPWPDPNSPILSKMDFGVPLVELFKWLDVRDTLLGDNERKQDIAAALALTRECKHPDAVWLTSIFEGKDVSTKEGAKKVFLLHQNDARALCFAWCLTHTMSEDLAMLRRAADMGYAFACSTLCEQVKFKNSEEIFRLARFAAAQHERDGLYWLGLYFENGVGCKADWNLGKENYRIAAELGHIEAADAFGSLFDESDPVRWLWWSRAALRRSPASFIYSLSDQVENFFCSSGSGNAKVVFLIGRALKGNIDEEGKEIFGTDYDFDSLIGPANRAVSFYESQMKSARLAVDTWTMVSTRLHLIKDMRIYIGKTIWEARFEANYYMNENDPQSSSPAQKRFRE